MESCSRSSNTRVTSIVVHIVDVNSIVVARLGRLKYTGPFFWSFASPSIL